MERLFAPWRQKYSDDVTEKKHANASKDACVFCSQFKENKDEENFIIKRFEHSIIMLNKFPYNAGHMLILPKAHVPNLSALSKDAKSEIMEIASIGADILSKTLKNGGLNIGINIGKLAGAGIPSHLHVHLLPRFEGDTNFMPTLTNTKLISYDMGDIYKQIKSEFDNLGKF